MKFWRRSQWNASEPLGPGIFLLDTIGELASIYQLADIAFVGGSLVAKGGHNILEAAQHGAAIVVGPVHGKFPRHGRALPPRRRRGGRHG